MIAKISSCLVFFICALTVYSLFMVKNRVRILNSQITEISKQIEEERDKIHILKAEFGYLTAPERLKKLSANLGLTNVTGKQMIKDPLVSNIVKNDIFDHVSVGGSTKYRVKWHYKKFPNKTNNINKYTQVTSHHAR